MASSNLSSPLWHVATALAMGVLASMTGHGGGARAAPRAVHPATGQAPPGVAASRGDRHGRLAPAPLTRGA